jgi:hypothetical protein
MLALRDDERTIRDDEKRDELFVCFGIFIRCESREKLHRIKAKAILTVNSGGEH